MANNILNRKFRYTYNNTTLILILINVAIFMLTTVSSEAYYYLALQPARIYYSHWYWQFFTYMFVHASFSHVFFNMLGLFFFGPPVERRLGSYEFLLFYLLIGFVSGVLSYFFYYLSNTNVLLVGASGAIYGVLFAFAVLYPYAKILMFYVIPVRAPVMVAIFTAIELFNQVFGQSGQIAHLTHLAGFGLAYLYFRLRLRIKPLDEWRRYRNRL